MNCTRKPFDDQIKRITKKLSSWVDVEFSQHSDAVCVLLNSKIRQVFLHKEYAVPIIN